MRVSAYLLKDKLLLLLSKIPRKVSAKSLSIKCTGWLEIFFILFGLLIKLYRYVTEPLSCSRIKLIV